MLKFARKILPFLHPFAFSSHFLCYKFFTLTALKDGGETAWGQVLRQGVFDDRLNFIHTSADAAQCAPWKTSEKRGENIGGFLAKHRNFEARLSEFSPPCLPLLLRLLPTFVFPPSEVRQDTPHSLFTSFHDFSRNNRASPLIYLYITNKHDPSCLQSQP